MQTKVKTACNRDCPDACTMIATVEDGRVVRLQGDPDHPVTQGFLCHRTSRFLERQYDPERLTTPLLRRGDGFIPIAWEDALDFAAEKMLRIKSEAGAAALMHYRCGGSLGLLKHVSDYFFARFGPCTIKSGDVCSGAGDTAQETDFGAEDSNDLFDLLNSKTIVLWGKNPYVSNVHLLPVLREARARGTRIVLVDPVRHRTADMCDLYLQPRPGGDIALALAVVRLLFARGQTDPAAASYCDHLDAFRACAFTRDVAAWAQLADVRADEIEALAESYANGPTALLIGWGLQRRLHGSAAVRVLDALCAVSGNLGISGGGASFYFKRRGAFDLSMGSEIEPPRRIPEPLLGRGILEASAPAIRMVWVTAANPVAMLPDSHSVARALATRELTVVVDSFLTDSARNAHLVLPTTTMLEDDDLLGAYGHHWLQELRPVIPPPDGVKTDYEIVRELARRVGLEGEFSDDVDTWKRRLLAPVSGRGASLEQLREGRPVRNPLAPKVHFADRKFPTPTGRVNLIESVQAEPFIPPASRPLLLMAISTDKSQSSQWPAKSQVGPVEAVLHPDSAPGFRDGDRARIESEMGALDIVLRFDPRQRTDVVLVPKGGWLHKGRCANVLVPARLTDAGGCAVYYDTPVRIVPAAAAEVSSSEARA